MDRDLDEELRFHLEMKARETGDRFTAQRAVGNALLLRERGRDVWGWRWLDELAQDLRYALRGMRRSPGFAAAAIVTLALAIAANCLVFSVADATLFRPFAFRDPDRLAYVWSRTPQANLLFSSVGNYLDWRAHNDVFEDLAAYAFYGPLYVSDGPYAEPIYFTRASANLFHVLGIEPELGRAFLPEEEFVGSRRVAMLSDRLWRTRFNADLKVIGSTISGTAYDGAAVTYTIVGIVPAYLEATRHTEDLWVPLLRDDADAKWFGGGGISVVGRLKFGVSLQAAEASMRTLVARLAPAHPKANRDLTVFLLSYRDELTRNSRPQTLLLLGAVGLVLLIACVNVAGLMLARGAERIKELTIRGAIGAGRSRLFRQLLTESLALGAIGGALGTALAFASVKFVRASLPPDTLRAETVAVNAKVLLFTLLTSLAAGLLAGLAPAWRASRVRIQPGLFSLQRGGHQRTLWRGGLIVTEIALALMLTVGAGLMVNTFVRLVTKDLGFDRRDLLVVDTDLPNWRYKTPAVRSPMEQQVRERLQSLPGVRRVAIGGSSPLWSMAQMEFRANPSEKGQVASIQAWTESVTPEYFDVMGVPMLRGRAFTSRDDSNSRQVAIVNQSFARAFWPGEDPLGKPVWIPAGKDEIECEVVGVVGNSIGMRLNQANALVYFPRTQRLSVSSLNIVVRLEPGLHPTAIVPAIRAELAAVDPLLVVQSSSSIQSIIDSQLAQPRFLTIVLGVFAALALGLTVTGIIGLVAYLVRARTYEFGLRMAMGAKPGDVLALICGYGGRLTALGILLGLGGALALTRLLSSYLYVITPTDPATLGGVALAVLLFAMMACYAPARKATRIDPARALRHD